MIWFWPLVKTAEAVREGMSIWKRLMVGNGSGSELEVDQEVR